MFSNEFSLSRISMHMHLGHLPVLREYIWIRRRIMSFFRPYTTPIDSPQRQLSRAHDENHRHSVLVLPNRYHDRSHPPFPREGILKPSKYICLSLLSVVHLQPLYSSLSSLSLSLSQHRRPNILTLVFQVSSVFYPGSETF